MKYPGGIQKVKASSNVVYGNRGMDLETYIEWINSRYENKNIAIIEKIPTPIQVVRSDGAKIKEAFYAKKSSVDYTGTYQGKPLWFDAKSTNNETSFPLKNIDDHQVERLILHQNCGAVCFFIIQFSKLNLHFLLPLNTFLPYWNQRQLSVRGKKSIPIDVIRKKAIQIPSTHRVPLDYLMAVEVMLSNP